MIMGHELELEALIPRNLKPEESSLIIDGFSEGFRTRYMVEPSLLRAGSFGHPQEPNLLDIAVCHLSAATIPEELVEPL